MKRALTAALLSLLLIAPTPLTASNPFSRALASTVIVKTDQAKCSGFVVGGHIVTAAHCVSEGDPAVAVFSSEDDIAVVVGETGLAPLKLGTAPEVGQQAWAVGYPDSSMEWPLVLSSSVAAVQSGYRPGAIRTIFHDGARKGMSGGPIINQAGDVIGMVSEVQENGGSVIMASPTVERLKAVVGAFWK